MVKTFRKLAALTAAVALVSSFAVCASAAVTVNMTTSYVDGSKIAVKAVVSDGEGTELDGAQVTYYATDADATATGGVVYMDQKPATAAGTATFEFKTDAAYINSAVKIGYTGADAAVTGNTIPDYTQFTLTVTDGAENSATTSLRAGDPLTNTYTVAYTPAAGKYVSALTVTGGTATITDAGTSSLTFALTMDGNVTGDVTITATESFNATGSENGVVSGAGGIVAGENSNDAVENGTLTETAKATAGNRKLTVIGRVTGLADDADYGVIVAASIDDTATTLPSERFFKALGKNDDGYFAVQLIDTADDASATFIKTGVPYQTAVYYKVGNAYRIVKGDTVTITAE